MATEQIHAVVIQAGGVGIACTRALVTRGIETLVIEHFYGNGKEASSRNREVIDVSLYCPPGLLKSRLGVQRMLCDNSVKPQTGL